MRSMRHYHQCEDTANSIGSKWLILPSLVFTCFFASIGFCDEIQWHRIEKLPSPSREAWIAFWERSLSIAKTSYDLDPASTEVYWARFYDLRTRQAIFPGRDGIVYDSFHAMSQSNALGYDYYSAIPESIVTTAQKKWRKRVMSSK